MLYVATLGEMIKKGHSFQLAPELKPQWGESPNLVKSWEEKRMAAGHVRVWEIRKYKGTGVNAPAQKQQKAQDGGRIVTNTEVYNEAGRGASDYKT